MKKNKPKQISYMQMYYLRNKEKMLKQNKKRYETKKEEILMKCREYRLKNIVSIREKDRERKRHTTEKRKQYVREYSKRPEVQIKRKKYRKTFKQSDKGKLHNIISNWKRLNRIKQTNTKIRLTRKELENIKQNYLYCVYCGSKNNLTFEHTTPVSKQGEHSVHNVVRACIKCNLTKGNKTLEEWFKTEYCQQKNINFDTFKKVI